jgi:hypothetical protein
MIVIFLLLVIFFSFSIVALSCVSINKYATIFGHVIFVWVPAIDVLPPIACHGGTQDSCSGFGVCNAYFQYRQIF